MIEPATTLPGSFDPLFNFAASLIKCEAGGDLIISQIFYLVTVITTGTGLPIKAGFLLNATKLHNINSLWPNAGPTGVLGLLDHLHFKFCYPAISFAI